ncbi:hypothetical protein QYE76_031023 [Lolium multiflorum]|uniref:Myb-like domain-containing protein n=1 Tax=Lolium multiflorum TaxID=4521 RepID=A0AAD8QQY0_LOLMU|nr:hypothetical protein QYE76_031023 [Lolium multiflorum]
MEADEPRRPSAGAARKSAPGQPWSDAETMHLIDVYEDRWTKLRRGQLKAQQWEDVAAEVTARCGGGQRKTGTQCRHKLEKLRKRYRTEGARPVTSLWPFFRRMERLERGPVALSSSFAASPPAAASPSDDDHEDEDDDNEAAADDDDDEEEEQVLVPRNSSNTRSINGILRDAGAGFRGFAPRQSPQSHQHQNQRPPSPPAVTLSTAPPRKRVAYEAAAFHSKPAEEDHRVKAEEAPFGGRPGTQISAVLKDFGEGVMRLERRRMEVQWEIERGWKETENRSNRMLQDAQRQLQDVLAGASAAPAPAPGKKPRRDHGGGADGL